MKEIRRYQASWGAWYVQIQFDDGQIVELKFDHDPKVEEVETKAFEVEKAIAETPIVESAPLVELTVDTAIAFLNEKLENNVETAKITTFITDKSVELKPIEVIKVVK